MLTFTHAGIGLELIPILISIDTSLYIGLGPVYRVIDAAYRAQTSTTVGNDTSSIGITSTPRWGFFTVALTLGNKTEEVDDEVLAAIAEHCQDLHTLKIIGCKKVTAEGGGCVISLKNPYAILTRLLTRFLTHIPRASYAILTHIPRTSRVISA